MSDTELQEMYDSGDVGMFIKQRVEWVEWKEGAITRSSHRTEQFIKDKIVIEQAKVDRIKDEIKQARDFLAGKDAEKALDEL